MKIEISSSALASALLIMAAISLFVMISMTRLDFIVHSVLYNFGLIFSYRWAMPYWVNSGIIMGLSWFNIAASIILIYYVFKGRKDLQSPKDQPLAEKASAKTEAQVEQPEDVMEIQILDQYFECPELQIRSYDVRHPEDIVDSQC